MDDVRQLKFMVVHIIYQGRRSRCPEVPPKKSRITVFVLTLSLYSYFIVLTILIVPLSLFLYLSLSSVSCLYVPLYLYLCRLHYHMSTSIP